MKIIRSVMAIAAALSLAGCKTSDIASAASLALGIVPIATQLAGDKQAAATPANGMTKESLDDSKRLYVSTLKRGAAAFRSGAIAVSGSPDVQRDNFCDLVRAGLHVVNDAGGQISAFECQAKDEIDKMIDAFERGDAVSFAAAKRTLSGHLAAMDTIISEAEKEPAS